jgi:hypothetical protein
MVVHLMILLLLQRINKDPLCVDVSHIPLRICILSVTSLTATTLIHYYKIHRTKRLSLLVFGVMAEIGYDHQFFK